MEKISSYQQCATTLVVLIGSTSDKLHTIIHAFIDKPNPLLPNKIIVLTTTDTKAQIEKISDSSWESFNAQLNATLQRHNDSHKGKYLLKHNESLEIITFDSLNLAEENFAVAEKLLTVLESETEDNKVRVVLALANVPTTLACLAYSVMSMVARHQDQALCLLPLSAPVHLAGSSSTYPASTHSPSAELAEVPLIPLRYLTADIACDSYSGYQQFMRRLSVCVKNQYGDSLIYADCQKSKIIVNDTPVQLSPREFALYLIFAQNAASGIRPVTNINDIINHNNCDPLHEIAKQYVCNHDSSHWSLRVMESTRTTEEDVRKLLSSIRGKMRQQHIPTKIVHRIVPRRGQPYIEVPAKNITISFQPPSMRIASLG